MSLETVRIYSQFTSAESDFLSTFAGLPYVHGDVLFIDSSGDIQRLGVGTSGQLLKTNGASADPSWATVAGTGDMTAAVYDPASITEQLVGLTATQTLTNKAINCDNNTITNLGFAEFDVDTADTMGFVAGAYLDSPSVAVTSDGTTITVTVEKDGGGDLRTHFVTGLAVIDTTPAVTATLTAGSDTVPVMNYIYFDEPTKTLTVNTTGFPVADIARIAEVLCQSATQVQTEGPISQRNWTDHLRSSTCGHLSHINVWIRSQPATWISGVMTTPTVTIQGAGEDNIDIAVSSGSVLQLHAHTYPAFDTSVSSHIHIVNDFTTPYVKITDLNAADTDDAGNAIGNNKYTNLVLWGVVSENTGDCQLMVNLPSAFHSSEDASTIDSERYSNYTIPTDYKGTGFLIARLTFKYSTSSSGTWTLVENKDLRNGGSTGGSGTGTTEFSDNVFRILDDADTSKEIAFQASALTTATTRTITMPDVDVTLATPTELAKLGGIEALADVTDTANVTSAGALMDSEVTNLAQVKAFDTTDYATSAQGTTADSALQDVVDDTTPVLGGDLNTSTFDIILGDGTSDTSSILLNDSALADEKWSGTTLIGTAGATLAIGDLCYLASTGKWLLLDGILDGTDTGYDKKLGICVDASTDTNPTEMLLDGLIASAAFPAFTIGSAVYASDTAGDMIVAQPSTTNFAIRIMGYATSATVLHFSPSPDYIVHV